MLQRRILLPLFAVMVLAFPALGQDKATLKWKFEKDKPFYQEMTTTTKQNMKVMGSDVAQTQTQTFYLSWTPEKQEADGSWVIKQKIEGVKMNIDIGGSKIDYDSTKEGSSTNPLGSFFKELVGSEFKLTVDKDFKITKIDGRADFIKKLVGANPQMEPLLNQILSEKALQEMADPTFAAAPNKEVKKGDTWDGKKSLLDMGPIGKYETTAKYTYEGKDENKLDKIKVDLTLNYTPPADSSTALPFKIKSAQLKAKDATGTIKFDSEKGRVAEADTKMTLEGTLGIEIAGQTTEVKLDQTQQTTIKTTDSNPIKK